MKNVLLAIAMILTIGCAGPSAIAEPSNDSMVEVTKKEYLQLQLINLSKEMKDKDAEIVKKVSEYPDLQKLLAEKNEISRKANEINKQIKASDN